MERKALLSELVIENKQLNVSRYIEHNGIIFFEAAKEKKLEGIVAKRKDSRYNLDQRTKNWIKCKVMSTEDCVVCGYINKANNMISLVLGQYENEKLVYMGHVTMGVSKRIFEDNLFKIIETSPFGYIPEGNKDAVWLEPAIVGIVESMPNEKQGFRQPVFKGVRNDKEPQECIK